MHDQVTASLPPEIMDTLKTNPALTSVMQHLEVLVQKYLRDKFRDVRAHELSTAIHLELAVTAPGRSESNDPKNLVRVVPQNST